MKLQGALVTAVCVVGIVGACHESASPILAGPFEQRLRPTQTGAIFTYDDGVELLNYDSVGGHFKVWYVTHTVDHVPLTDNDNSGIPDYVELVGERYEAVYEVLITDLGFRPPLRDTDPAVNIVDDGGDDRFDVYLIDFAGAGDGAFGIDGCRVDNPDQCAGHMAQENDFVGYGYPDLRTAVTVLSSHEFFHAIQAAYDAGQDTWWAEATAVWSEENFDPSQDDFESFLPGYFNEPERSLDVPPIGSVDAFSYGMGILPWFLDHRFDQEIVKQVWEALENGAYDVEDPEPLGAMDRVLAADYDSSFAEAFSEFAVWNTLTGVFADPTRSYSTGADYPLLKYEWNGDLPLLQESLRVYHASVQYFHADLGGRDEVTAAFVEQAPTALRMAVMLEYGAQRDGPYWLDDLDSETPTVLDASGYDSALLMVINKDQDGRSAQPTLCFGSPQEVKLCRFGEGSGGDSPAPEPESSGCAAMSNGVAFSPVSMIVLMIGLLVRRARRRR